MVTLGTKEILGSGSYHTAETVLRDDHPTFLHDHQFYEMFLVTEGRMVHILNGADQEMAADTLCLVRPEDIHCFRRCAGEVTHFVNLAFSARVFAQALALHRQYTSMEADFTVSRTARLPAGLSQALLAKIAYLSRAVPGLIRVNRQEVLMGAVLDGLTFLCDIAKDAPTAPQWLAGACEAMQKPENYTIGLQRLVALCGRSQEHVTRTMSKHYGATPSSFVNSLRLDAAVRLLKTTDRTVLDILLSCGFNNVSHFNQLFKAEFGITPSRYRRLNQTVISPGQNERHGSI